MSATSQALRAAEQPSRVLLPALVGGIAAATLDAASAFLTFGWGMPRGIASGLLSMQMLLVGMPISLSFRLLAGPIGTSVSL